MMTGASPKGRRSAPPEACVGTPTCVDGNGPNRISLVTSSRGAADGASEADGNSDKEDHYSATLRIEKPQQWDLGRHVVEPCRLRAGLKPCPTPAYWEPVKDL